MRRHRASRWREVPFAPLWLLLACTLGWTTSDTELLADLVASFDHAVTEPLVVEIDVGTMPGRKYLVEGWYTDEEEGDTGRTFAWGQGGGSVLELSLVEPGPLDVEMHVRAYSWPGAPPQFVTVEANSFAVAEFELSSEWQDVAVSIPPERLRAGLNRIGFVYAHSGAPAEVSKNGDTRQLAVAWDHIRLITAQRARAQRAEGRIHIPYGTSAAFSLMLPRDAVFRWSGLEPEDGRLAVVVRAPADGTQTLHEVTGAAGALTLSEPGALSELRRIELVALPPPGDTRALGGMSVRRPILDAPPGALGDQPVFPRAPNVLIYLIDALRADHLGCYGYDRPVSPRLDELARDGVLFEKAIAESPWTRPSIATLLTGLHPQAHKAVGRKDRLPDSIRTLAETLHDAGLATAGVTTNGNVSPQFGFARGYDSYTYLPESATGRIHHTAAEVNSKAFMWLDRERGERPFFLFLHVCDPHGPYTPLPRFRRRFAPEVPEGEFGSMKWLEALHAKQLEVTPKLIEDALRLYDAEIAYTDYQFGRLVDGLKRRGLYEDTLIIVTSDHGEEFYEHGDWEHGATLYNEVLHIPLIVKYPRTAPVAPGRSQRAAQLVDIAPTILDVTRLGIPEQLPGESLFRATRESADELRSVYSHLALVRNATSVQQGSWKFLRFQDPEKPLAKLLFNHASDPREYESVLLRHLELAAGLEARLDEHVARATSEIDAEEVEIDAELEKRLRALGYLD